MSGQIQEERSVVVEGRGARSASRVSSLISVVPPVWWGLAGLALVSVIFTTATSAYSMFIYSSILLAIIGAVALQVLQGTAGLLSVGNAAFLLVGAFSAVFVVREGLPPLVSLVVAPVVAGVGGVVVALTALRLRGLFLVLATLAAHFVAVFLGNLYQSHVAEARDAGFFVPILFQSSTDGPQYWVWMLFGFAGLVIVGATLLVRGRTGRALRMIRDHEHIAPTLGISVSGYKMMVFTLTSMVVGFEGALTAQLSGSVTVANFPILLAFQYVLMIVIGGLDSILGAVLGAAAVVALPIVVPDILKGVWGDSLNPTVGSNTSLIVYGLLVILFVVGSPDGIVGLLRRLWRFAQRLRPTA